MQVETREIIILHIAKVQNEKQDDIERELKIELTDQTAIFYFDDELIGSVDSEHIWTFKDALVRVLKNIEDYTNQ